MKFIPIDKMKALRESARNGDERAKQILSMQLSGEGDFSGLLDEYFKPAEPAPVVAKANTDEQAPAEMVESHKDKLQEFLDSNGVKEGDEDYDEVVQMFYNEFPNYKKGEEMHEEHVIEEDKCVIKKLIGEEMDAIRSYSDAIIEVMNSDDYNANEKKGVIDRLEEIKKDEIEHFEELKRLIEKTVKVEEEVKLEE